MSPFQIFLAILAGVGITSLVLWFFYFRHFHIGFGMVLERRQSDGTVWVVSRLMGSPAWKVGVQNKIQVLSVDGVSIIFRNNKDFCRWVKRNLVTQGKTERWVFQGNFIANLKPGLITQQIPVYWSPNNKEESLFTNDGATAAGLRYCEKTGQYFRKRKVPNKNGMQVHF